MHQQKLFTRFEDSLNHCFYAEYYASVIHPDMNMVKTKTLAIIRVRKSSVFVLYNIIVNCCHPEIGKFKYHGTIPYSSHNLCIFATTLNYNVIGIFFLYFCDRFVKSSVIRFAVTQSQNVAVDVCLLPFIKLSYSNKCFERKFRSESVMFSFHKPKVYRSAQGCCICKAKSSSSRFTDSKKYENDFIECFQLSSPRCGEICNACVLLVKRFKRLPPGSERHWSHVSYLLCFSRRMMVEFVSSN